MRWIISLFVLLFGLVTLDLTSLKWAVTGLILYSLPVLLQFARSKLLHVYALWAGLFLVLQALISPLQLDQDFRTLKPDLYAVVDRQGNVPGISGKQVITTDHKGFRTTKEVDYESNDSLRIFAIGGSTTEQIVLDDHATWTHGLQERLSAVSQSEVEVINTGLSGLRARHHLATLNAITSMHPDLVIFLIGVNDWNRHIEDAYRKGHPLAKLDEWRSTFLLGDTLLGRFLVMLLDGFKQLKGETGPVEVETHGAWWLQRKGGLDRKENFSFRPDSVSDEYKRQLNAISDACHRHRIDCMFITQPTAYHEAASEALKDTYWMTPPDASYTLSLDDLVRIADLYNSYLTESLSSRGHYICDAAAKLPPSFDIFFDDCHFNTNGAERMSGIVAACVKDMYRKKVE